MADLDIEMDLDDYQEPVSIPAVYTEDIITGEEQEPGEVEDNDISDQSVILTKVHIRGLDSFKPDDVHGYLRENDSKTAFERIEWIDDSSANLLYKSEGAAQEALIALASVDIADPTQLPPLELIPAKRYAAKPESDLQIRFAVATDKKTAGAAHRSRFYLFNPEYDPEERRRRGEFQRNKYRDRDNRSYDRRRDRRDEETPEPFDVNLYDDDSTALATRLQRSGSRDSSGVDRPRSRDHRSRPKELFPKRTNDLFPDRRSGNGSGLRDRSASPIRADRDADVLMDLDEDARAAAALRSRERGRSIRERLSKDSGKKELFPTKDTGTKELFPEKAGTLVSKAQMDQVANTTVMTSDRITTRPTSNGPGGFSIRGIAAASRSGDQGIAIKGRGATAKELFPEKFGNAGKELFAEKITNAPPIPTSTPELLSPPTPPLRTPDSSPTKHRFRSFESLRRASSNILNSAGTSSSNDKLRHNHSHSYSPFAFASNKNNLTQQRASSSLWTPAPIGALPLGELDPDEDKDGGLRRVLVGRRGEAGNWHNPNLMQMVETLRAVMIRKHDALESIPIVYNSYVMSLIEGFAHINQRLESCQAELDELKRARSMELEQFRAISEEWMDREGAYKAEIKRLELVLAKESIDGVASVALARHESLVDRSGTKRFKARLERMSGSHERGELLRTSGGKSICGLMSSQQQIGTPEKPLQISTPPLAPARPLGNTV
ncbi:hypothetical protein QBC38DRAFT_362260 [Podospora fimiseda]|uniref:Uncharacterized protein n=1 Tax=Podospora fimiseda TaxID=252190 RepID=A0AAN7H3L2_9PEZI|nr:hypothetical protein QBC38DRAFT_362260 [Podospora fimiseda]